MVEAHSSTKWQHPLGNSFRGTYAVVKVVAVKVPRGKELDSVALGLGPGAAVGKRREEGEDGGGENQE